ncbi:MAG: DUF4203 domain-containing protein [Candidatus Hydrogenedentes bacterium]|nr:DUF4203 domain-containing protein [Candidatus Hydrogenedentota bacterium]
MNALSTWKLEDLPPDQAPVALAIAVLVGLLYAFLGYRLLKFFIGFTGFLIAGAVATLLAGWLSAGHMIAMAACGLLGGLCGAMALFFLYKTGIFAIGFLGAFLAAFSLLQGRPETWIPWAIIGLALAGGLLALFLERAAMTLATAAIGSWLVTNAALLLFLQSNSAALWNEKLTAQQQSWTLIALWGLVACLGAGVQFFGGPGSGNDEEE